MTHPIYLDYCATTPVDAGVRDAMLAALQADFGNPSSMHWAGRNAARLLAQARAQVAQGIGCAPEEITFTSGATEADNLALFGLMRRHAPGAAHLITTQIEHHAILHAADVLEREGYAVTRLPVDGQGLVDPQDVRRALRPETKLISVMLVNNETGAVQPVKAIAALARAAGVPVHTDAVQGIGLLGADVDGLGVDLLSLSAHKIYGPKGVGVLYVRSGTGLAAQLHGGPQEGGLRPGTENMPGIVGLGAAVERVGAVRAGERERLTGLRSRLIDGLRDRIPGLLVNGPTEAVSPHVASLSFPGADGEMMLIRLNGAGVAVSLGSACTSREILPSHVLTAMGLPRAQIEATLRVSLGMPTTPEEIDAFVALAAEIWPQARLS